MVIRKQKTHESARQASQKTLLPTLKEQQRYIVYELVSPSRPEHFKDIHAGVIRECRTMLGLFDGAKAGMLAVMYDEKNARGMIRIDSRYVSKLRVCLGLIRSLNIAGRQIDNIMINPIYVSGMLGKAEQRLNNA